MKGTLLDKIFESKRRRVELAKTAVDVDAVVSLARSARLGAEPHRFRRAISDVAKVNIIAEFKRSSPSKGAINDSAEPAATAMRYEAGGAAAISVLTEEEHFQGSMDDLRAIRKVVAIPILRKDFVFDSFQIYEAAAAGADAILLIAAMLDDGQLADLRTLAEDELGMDALVEVHTREELERVSKFPPKMIGVNNRNLATFEVSLDVSLELIGHFPAGALAVAESGLSGVDDVRSLREIGYSAFLIGETLMRSGDPAQYLMEFTAAQRTDHPQQIN